MKREELLKIAKPMMVNLEVAKTMDRKAQTRRVIKSDILETDCLELKQKDGNMYLKITYQNGVYKEVKAKYQLGDILWIREPAEVLHHVDIDGYFEITYRFADGEIASLTMEDLIKKHGLKDYEFESKYLCKKWIERHQKVPNGCTKEMARDFRRVTNIRVERLQGITLSDIEAEGVDMRLDCFVGECTYKNEIYKRWINLWNKTAPKGYKWEDNPFVFVYEFEKIEVEI
ncbi:MAG: hypothetical protein PHW89_08000 [Sulfurimonas denitrificans]|nr:hypothetical protein [Sulfurimonas denitrificans]